MPPSRRALAKPWSAPLVANQLKDSADTAGPVNVADISAQEPTYPVRFSVDYPDRPLDRLTTAFRVIVAILIFIVLAAVSGGI